MPPLIPAVVAVATFATSTAGVALITTGATLAIGASQRKKAGKRADSEARQIQAINKERQDQNRIQLSEDRKLAEKQLALQAQRTQLETLAFLKSRKDQRPRFNINQAPQPIRQQDIISRINAFISNLF